jgi:hypothetical protein
MYQSAIRHIPVHWIIGFFDVVNFAVDLVHGILNRTCSFAMTNFWNLSGLDTYYVFLDENPSPIPYPKFVMGGIYEQKWYYSTRTREFSYGDYRSTARTYLPAIMGTYKHVRNDGDETTYDITEFLNKLKFKSFPHIFPTPAQLLNAWSLHSGIWLSLERGGAHTLTVMNGNTGEDVVIPLTYGNRFPWTTLIVDSESDTDSESEEDSDSDSKDDTATDSKSDIAPTDQDLQVIAPTDAPAIPI